MSGSTQARVSRDVLIGIALLLTIVAVFVPFSPDMPMSGLDPSWRFAMNEAVARGLDFGRDIVFSFGPYSSVYTKAYHPATDHLMIHGSLFLALAYAAGLWMLARDRSAFWKISFCLILGGTMMARDPLFFSYPLVVALVVHRYARPEAEEAAAMDARWAPLFAVLLFAPFGLLPLVKGTNILICTVISALSMFTLLRGRRWTLLLAAGLAPLATMIAFWAWSGQSMEALPNYLANMGPIVSGYTEAMAYSAQGGGQDGELVFYVLLSVAVLYLVQSARQLARWSRIFLGLAFAGYLFVAFKGGFVRHDGHALIATSSALMGVALLGLVLRHPRLPLVLGLSASLWCYSCMLHVGDPLLHFPDRLTGSYWDAYRGLKQRVFDPQDLPRRFEAAVASIQAEGRVPTLKGTADIYSYNQSYLLASASTWTPRPVFQSYSAYTKELALKNEAHLVGEGAPDNIVFRVETIDGRLPSLDDGASWPTLLNAYLPTRLVNNFVYLEKEPGVHPRPKLHVVHEGVHRLGESISVAPGDGLVFATLEIKPNVWGRLVTLLHRPNPLEIKVELADGSSRTFRMVSGMGEAGFVISPLVEHSAEFALLYAHSLSGKAIKSIRIDGSEGRSALWRKRYRLTLSRFDIERRAEVLKIFDFDSMQVKSRDESRPRNAGPCEGSIDMVNGVLAPSSTLAARNILSVEGWLAVSTKDGAAPDQTFVTLTGERGDVVEVRARSAPRNDVKVHFGQPNMKDVGYKAFIDISRLSGRYWMGLSRVYGGRLEHCEQFKLPLAIAPQ